MDFFTNVVGSYGYDGLALIVLLLLFFGIQVYYYGVVYRRIPRYRINMLPVRRESEPPVSVVIVTQEDMQFVEERLPMFLTQDYSDPSADAVSDLEQTGSEFRNQGVAIRTHTLFDERHSPDVGPLAAADGAGIYACGYRTGLLRG